MCAALYSILYTGLLCWWPAIPSQDAPAWILEATLLRDQLAGHGRGGCELVQALPPNAFAQLAIAGLELWLPAALAGRLYLSACVTGLCAALVYACRARDASGQSGAVLAVLPLCAGYPLYHGFLNYMAALPVLCFGAGALLRNPEARGLRGIALLLLLPTWLYTCHGTALGVWGLWVAAQAWVRRSWQLLLRAAFGMMPVLALLWLYVMQRSAEGAFITWSAGSFLGTLAYRLRSPLRFLSIFHGLAPTFDDAALRALAPLWVALNVGYALVLCGLGLGWAWRMRRSADAGDRFISLSLLSLVACFVLLPHDVAKMLNPAERLVLPAALLGAVGLARAGASGIHVKRARMLRASQYTLLALQSLYVLVWGTRAAQASAALVRARAHFGFDAPVVQVRQLSFAPPAPSLGAVSVLPRHQVLAMQGMLDAYWAGHFVSPFDTGLFRCSTQAQPSPSTWDREVFRRHERPLVLLGEREQVLGVIEDLGPGYTEIEVGTGFSVCRRTAP